MSYDTNHTRITQRLDLEKTKLDKSHDYFLNIGSMKGTNTMNAADKAWVTRRKNAAKKSSGRIGAGKRAWETRRRNERAAMLSARALKAWETRRARA